MSVTQLLRPQYHFTPPAQWMNDPNGLVYAGGEYHLFYQHHPGGLSWGPMHWGHAASADLVHWRHLPIALSPDAQGNIFSGSAVVDRANTAGFGAGALVAAFTHDQHGAQRQSLAYSRDGGQTWGKYAGNPVLAAPDGLRDFRDPKVFWYVSGDAGHWVMLVAAVDRILFYTSPDLKVWTASGSFGPGYGSTAGVWETPELLHLPVDGGPAARWVLLVGVPKGAPAGGSGTQYFVGQFDGQTFTSDAPAATALWADYGADFYAAQAWNDAPGGRHLVVAWMNNWDYANQIPTSTWRGALTLPRELSLADAPQGVRLTQQPLPELQRLRGQHWSWQNVSLPAAGLLDGVTGDTLEIIAEFQMSAATSADRFGFRVRVGAPSGDGEHTAIGYATKHPTLYVDRTQSGQMDFSPNFRGIHTVEMPPSDESVRLAIFVDRASVEVFGNNGIAVITDQIFPAGASLRLEAFADGGQVVLKSLDVWQIDAAKFQADPNQAAGELQPTVTP